MSGRLTWLGHASVVIELDGARVITDPLLRPRVGHLRREAAVPSDVGRLDAILVSHAHHDHLDLPSLRLIDPAVPVLAPPAAARALRRTGRSVHALSPGEELPLAGLRVRAVPAAHDGRRLPVGRAACALGYVIAGSRSVYFAGDTEPFDGMRELAGALHAALLPVAGWGPRLGAGHMDARAAAHALTLLRPDLAVPIHWGTYRRIGHHPHGAPAVEFASLAAELAPHVRVAVLAPGGTVEITPVV